MGPDPTGMKGFVREWCNEQNSVSGANRYLIAAIIVAAIGLVVFSTLTGFGILITAGAGIAWYQLAPKPWNLNHLGNETPVPDDLMKAMASSNQVPMEVKVMLSERLRKKNVLHFSDIWDVDAHFRTKANEAARALGDGHKALLTYSKSDVEV